MKKLTLKILLLTTSSLFAKSFITLGTGEENGTYYPVGLSMCKFINQKQKEIKCSVESTNGAIYNINAVLNEKFNFAISQSDTIYHALNKTKNFKNSNTNELRSVIAIYPELFSFIVSKQSNISKIEDIVGKKINIGSLNSGSELTTLEILNEYNIKKTDLGQASSLDAMDTVDALKDNIIDGYFFMVGHPTQNIKDAIELSDISIIPIKGKKIDSLVKKRSYFTKASIDARLYEKIDTSIDTIGTKSVIISSAKVSEELVYNFVKIIMENFKEFKNSHGVYRNLTKESLFEGVTAPLHNGVKRYLQEEKNNSSH
ncbi:TAXI family TRAP transporter solute-binding subunit [Arcobacteraceae bacterium]|nr:TAXI family TRAP transporter solute-binding subunit [Arcobacteraceae bacterium]